MNHRKRHQTQPADAPAALRARVSRTVRFEEVDAVRYMWHGRYASWLEDGREAMGRLYPPLSYLNFRDHNILVPLKLFQLDFHRPLLYGQTYTICAELLWNEAAVLDYVYQIVDGNGITTTTAATTQLMLDSNGSLLLEQPAFYKAFCRSWQKGALACAS